MNPAVQPLQAADLRGTLLLRDCLGAEGAFLLVQLVKAALGSGPNPAAPPVAVSAAAPARVVLLAAAQAASHYAAVLRKAGLHYPTLQETGRLTIVEALPGQGNLPSLCDLHQRLTAAASGGSGGRQEGSDSSSCSSGVVLVADDLTVRGGCCQGHGCITGTQCVYCGRLLRLCSTVSSVQPCIAAASQPAVNHTAHPWAVRCPPCRCCAAWRAAKPTGQHSCRPAQRSGRCGRVSARPLRHLLAGRAVVKPAQLLLEARSTSPCVTGLSSSKNHRPLPVPQSPLLPTAPRLLLCGAGAWRCGRRRGLAGAPGACSLGERRRRQACVVWRCSSRSACCALTGPRLHSHTTGQHVCCLPRCQGSSLLAICLGPQVYRPAA